MKTAILPALNGLILPLLLSVAVIVVTYAVLNGTGLPFVVGPRAGLIALLIIGMAMCTLGGIAQVGVSGRWLAPLAVIGMVLGVTLLVIIVAGLFGWPLPFIRTPNDAVLAVAALIGIKTLIGTVSYVFHLL